MNHFPVLSKLSNTEVEEYIWMRENNCDWVWKWKIYLRTREEKIDIRGLKSERMREETGVLI